MWSGKKFCKVDNVLYEEETFRKKVKEYFSRLMPGEQKKATDNNEIFTHNIQEELAGGFEDFLYHLYCDTVMAYTYVFFLPITEKEKVIDTFCEDVFRWVDMDLIQELPLMED